MTHTIIAVLVAAAVALGSPAVSAQQMTDQQFITLAGTGGLAEVELGRLAAERGAHGSVQQFGQRMVTDHGAMNAQLAQLARRKGMSVPTGLDDVHLQKKDRLSRLAGQEFDRAYMQDMVSDHMKDVSHFEHQAQAGIDPDLKAFAAAALPVLRQHLELARNVNTQVVLGPPAPAQPAASPMARPLPTAPWCGGAYAPTGGTNFGTCIAR